MLNENIKKYSELQIKSEELKAEMDALKESIINEMRQTGVIDTKVDNISAKLVTRETFKYTDELSIIKYLKENGYSQMIEEKIKTSALNTELKKGQVLTESLNPLFKKTVSDTLVIKRG